MSERAAPTEHARTRLEGPLSDAALGLAVTLVMCVVIAADRGARSPVEGIICAIGFGALMLLRRRFPLIVLAVTILGIFAYYIAGFPPIGMVLPAVGALYSAAEMRRTVWAIVGAAVLITVASVYRMDGSEPESALNGYTFMTELALAAAAIALGASVRLTREARARTAQIAELTAADEAHATEARLQAERIRIARDLHDTIGHTLSVASLHSSVAAESIGRDDEEARRALDHVRDAAAEALREVRRTVKVLRDDDAVVPPPGLAAIDPLLEAVRAADVEVDARIHVPPGALSPSTDTAAFRIVQESLTNVLRHANAHTVTVRVTVADDVLMVQIADDGTSDGLAAEGAGIRGMRERAELLGGGLTATRRADGFTIDARFPIADDQTDEETA